MAKFYFKKWPSFTLRNGEIAICGFTTTRTTADNYDCTCYSLNFRIFTRPNGRNAAYYCTSKPENAIFGKIIWQQAKSSLSLQRPFRHNRKQKRIIIRVVADAQNLTKSFWKSNNPRWKILYQIFLGFWAKRPENKESRNFCLFCYFRPFL